MAEAKAKLSEIIKRVEEGEQVTITRRGKPVARLSATQAPKKPLPSRAEFREKHGNIKTSAVEDLIAMREEYRY
ncbi:type II toxin-antitoxin system Phd/YefM family antitoxin [Truepera radiovictrix]|uniref:type II toxin-antitoxin system Phd/YefM family antitoxin n=1 Tax=Truepera radiovictrix TaxID=332249 RepID=UPI000673FFC0|nr:type II toxin-antitoxin system prevent-host-death family antitoxin [Truepera radiovictrix]WMT58557.1 type II toxin-antitoxin system prevent-host-death family antitoxin [Truepera radiovictrix]